MSTACIVLASPHGPAPQCVYPRCVADTPNYCEPVHGCETAVGGAITPHLRTPGTSVIPRMATPT